MLEFLGLTRTEASGIWHLPVTRAICGGRDAIYGGAALAAALEVAERESGRPTVWTACHFLRPALVDATVTLQWVSGAVGGRVTHGRVIGSANDEELFCVMVSLGNRPHPARGVACRMPEVPDPEDCPPRYIRDGFLGGIREVMLERAVTDDPTGVMHSTDGRAAVWITLPGGIPGTASAMALIGDEVSTGTSAVVHPDAQAPSIDNTLRILTPKATEWVLADIEVRAMDRGFAHGLVNLWSQDGRLLAIAEQTGALRTRGD